VIFRSIFKTVLTRFLPVACAAWLLGGANALAQESIIIDHTCTDLSEVPATWIEAAKAQFKASYGHTSHGSQVVTGMDLIKGTPGSLYWFDHDGTSGGLSLHDGTPSGDLGNPDRYTWATLTRSMLNAPGNDRNLVIWSWCGQADTTAANMQIYLDLMSGLEADYPDVTFVYMTGHLEGTGEEGSLHQRNNQIRDHCIANDAVLFDFADIESYDPDGSDFLDLGADDGCNYSGGNWADEWCAAHPGDALCAPCSCAHSRPLNCNLKARAFWWMMARLTGWDGTSETTTACNDSLDNDGDSLIDLDDPDCTDENDPLEAPDADEDLVEDDLDNCVQVANPGQQDTDGDDYGNLCDCDFNQTLTCNITDFNVFLPDFLATADSGIGTDMDSSGSVGIADFNLFLPGFVAGEPGPSGLIP